MGWRSLFSRNPDHAREEMAVDETAVAPRTDPKATSDRREEIILSLTAHLQTVRASKTRAGGGAAIDVQADLYEAGYVDSLGVSEFLLLAETQYGIELPDWLVGCEANSIATLAAYIETKLAKDGA
jgi:acyl carrier protein